MNNASENGFDDCLHLIYRGNRVHICHLAKRMV